MIKLLAFDLDGTLLTDYGDITETTKAGLIKLIEKNILILPCSARPYYLMPSWLREEKRIPYLVCQNGAKIVNNLTLEIEEVHLLERLKIIEICEHLKEFTEKFSFNMEENIVSTLATYEYLRTQDNQFKTSMIHVPNRYYVSEYKPFLNKIETIDRLHICVDSYEEKELIYTEAKKIKDISVVSSHPNNVEIMHYKATKGNALITIMNQYGIKKEETMAVGDNDNDISLIQAAGYGVAMKNASPALKQKAGFITEQDNNHEGVMQYVESYLKNESKS